VSLSFAGAPVDVPGIRITARSRQQATGYLDRRSAARLGAYLRSVPRGTRPAGTSMRALTRVALDPPAPAFPKPAPPVTLNLRVTPPTGAKRRARP
jgi:hypothetical protein